jgi:PKD repeat protein
MSKPVNNILNIMVFKLIAVTIFIMLLAPSDAAASILFGSGKVIGASSDGVTDVAVVDLDKDGDMDVVSVNDKGEVIVWQNDGTPFDGGLWNQNVVGNSSDFVYSVEVADLDKDGDLDIVTGIGQGEDYNLIAWENDGTPFDGEWTQHDLGTARGIVTLALVDLDGDSWIDIVTTGTCCKAGYDTYGDVIIWHNDGTPFTGLWSGVTLYSDWALNGVKVADLDKDGDNDIVFTYHEYYVKLLQNDGTPFDGGWKQSDVGYACPGMINGLDLADYDSDGYLDIVTACGYNPARPQYIFRNDHSPFDGGWISNSIGTIRSYTDASADFDLDGDIDMATADAGNLKAVLWENDGTPFSGAWTKNDLVGPVSHSFSLAAADFDRDGDMDIVSGGRGPINDYKIIVWENLQIHNRLPIVNAGPDQSANKGATVTFSGSFTDSDPADSHTISWDFGDVSASVTGTLTPTHVYANNGDYTVTLTVTDSNGGVGTDTMKVTVNSIPVLYKTDIMGVGVKNDAVSDDPMLFRMDKDGNIIWEKSIPLVHLQLVYHNMADRNLKEDSLYIMISFGNVNKIDGKSRIQKYDANGNLIWDISVSPETNWVSANEVNGGIYAADANSGIYRIDSEGNILWGPKNFGYSSSPANWFVATDVTNGGAFASNYANNVVVKIDKDGNVIWTKSIPEAIRLNTNPIDGGVYVGAGDYARNTYRLDEEGNIIWNKNSFPSPWTYSRGVSPIDGALYLNGGWPFLFAKIAMDGTVLWNVNNAPYDGFTWATFSAGISPAIDSDEVYTGDMYWGNLGISKFIGSDGSQAGLIWHKNPGYFVYTGGYGPVYNVYTGMPSRAPAEPSVPVANPGGPYTGNEGEPIAFDASASSPGNPDRSIVSYEWNFGDGTTSTGVYPSYAYADNGSYTATLTVTDNNVPAKTDTKTVAVTVNNVPPTATLNAPPSVNEGSAITLSLTNPSDPSTADTAAGLLFAFDCGTGFSEYGSESTASCPTTDNGARAVKARIKDKDGGETEYTASVTINNVAPVVNAGQDQTVNEGILVNLAPSTFSDPGTSDTHTATINWGDGTDLETGTVAESVGSGTVSGSHSYPKYGSYTVETCVTDDDGASSCDSFELTVSDITPPVITINGENPLTAILGAPYADAGATATDNSDGTLPVTTTGAVDTATVGTYTLTYTATDASLNTATASRTVKVIYAPAGSMCLGKPGHEILQPINNDGSSTFKKGSTVPAKFRVCDSNGNSIGTSVLVSSFKLIKKVYGTVNEVNEDVISTTPDTAFRLDTTDQQWIFNINTKSLLASYTYTYRISLNDGTYIDFTLGLK